ncbi:MAG: transcription elongation factor GreA [Proteobacteria bacterium]|nr:transcription elongation factor GreA [Pseudomonadota bacterium]
MDRKPITAKGYKKLQEELSQLIKEERPKIINDIAVARSHGDLKENAEYHAAKEKQGFIEGRIQHLNAIIADSEVVDVSKTEADDVRFGATVTYEDLDSGETASWKIVGEEETDIENREISIKSPIAQSLLGKEEGDEVVLRVPKGSIEVEIISVEYK